jgi:hypothetical protein
MLSASQALAALRELFMRRRFGSDGVATTRD